MSVQARYAQLVTQRKTIKSTPPQAGPAHRKAGSAPAFSYERWAVGRLSLGTRCTLETSMSCIPLREDPICRGCFEGAREEAVSGQCEGADK